MSAANDNIVAASSVQLVAPASVADVPVYPADSNVERVTQQRLLPSSVKDRILDNLVTSSASGLGNGSFRQFAIPASTSASFIFTISDKRGRTIVAVPDVAFFIDKISAQNQWPNATYGMGTMPISVFNDWGLTDNINTVTRCVVRNNFASDVLVIAVCRWRVITNANVALPQADVDSGQLLSQATSAFGGRGGGPF